MYSQARLIRLVPRRVSGEAGAPDAQEAVAAVIATARPELPAEKLAEWAQLKAYRPQPRRQR